MLPDQPDSRPSASTFELYHTFSSLSFFFVVFVGYSEGKERNYHVLGMTSG